MRIQLLKYTVNQCLANLSILYQNFRYRHTTTRSIALNEKVINAVPSDLINFLPD